MDMRNLLQALPDAPNWLMNPSETREAIRRQNLLAAAPMDLQEQEMTQPMQFTVGQAADLGANFLPGVGEAIDAADLTDALQNQQYGQAVLPAIGLALPMVAGLGSLGKLMSGDVSDIRQAKGFGGNQLGATTRDGQPLAASEGAMRKADESLRSAESSRPLFQDDDFFNGGVAGIAEPAIEDTRHAQRGG